MKDFSDKTNLRKGTQIMDKFKKGVGKHSVLVTFLLATAGVGMTVYLAQKEIPRAKKEIKSILKNDKPKKQRNKDVAKSVVKNCWKTTVIAASTILLVTGTSAIATANAATTIAGLTGAAKFAEQKADAYEKAVNDIPDEKIKEEVKQTVTKTMEPCEEHIGKCETQYVWLDKYTGVKFKATFKQIEAAGEIIDLKIRLHDKMMLRDFYIELLDMGAIFFDDDWPDFFDDHGWYDEMRLKIDSYHDCDGFLVHYIEYKDPKTEF